jgi:hypothetical protein
MAKAIVGKMVCADVPHRATGNQPNFTANTYCNNPANTNEGIDVPITAIIVDEKSIGLFLKIEANNPRIIPKIDPTTSA